jgi:hypothetical protein
MAYHRAHAPEQHQIESRREATTLGAEREQIGTDPAAVLAPERNVRAIIDGVLSAQLDHRFEMKIELTVIEEIDAEGRRLDGFDGGFGFGGRRRLSVLRLLSSGNVTISGAILMDNRRGGERADACHLCCRTGRRRRGRRITPGPDEDRQLDEGDDAERRRQACLVQGSVQDCNGDADGRDRQSAQGAEHHGGGKTVPGRHHRPCPNERLGHSCAMLHPDGSPVPKLPRRPNRFGKRLDSRCPSYNRTARQIAGCRRLASQKNA